MKVNELIEWLEKLDQDSIVVVRGYESGVNEIDRIKAGFIFPVNGASKWEGDFDFSMDSGYYAKKAIFLRSTKDDK